MISVITIILFFIYTWGFGFSALYFVKKNENFFERQFLYLGVGLGVFSFLGILLNFLHIPLDWKIFLIISLILPLKVLVKNRKGISKKIISPKIKISKATIFFILVLIIASVSFYVYASGAFSYPYLEDEDPWGHSVGVKYVALEKNAYDPVLQNVRKMDPVLSYIDPYPPAFDIILGVLHQTSPDITWTMKFFNVLIICLGMIFFYLMAQIFLRSRAKALLATFILASIPSYLSHFIWAHSLVITLFFPTIIAFEMSRKEKKWTWIATLMVGAIWVAQNFSQPIKLSTMLIIFLVVISITKRKIFYRGFVAFFSGVSISLIWWGAMLHKYGLRDFLAYFDIGRVSDAQATVTGELYAASAEKISAFAKLGKVIEGLVSSGGSSSRSYSFTDFFIAEGQNQINNPIGIGIVISLLTLLGVILILWKNKESIVSSKSTYLCITIFWLIFAFWGVNGRGFPISVARGPFRVWMLLAIPISLIAAEGIFALKNLSTNKVIRFIIIMALLTGIVFTSAHQKYQLNTAIWPTSGAFVTNQVEATEYGNWFQTINPGTKVFLYSPRDKIVIGLGGHSCLWCQEVIDFRKNITQRNAKEIHTFLKQNNYEYFIINMRMEMKYFLPESSNEEKQKIIQQKYQEILSSTLFIPIHQPQQHYAMLKVI